MRGQLRPAQLQDAQGLARVHVITWKTAYRGLIADSYLDALTIEWRAERWAGMLAKPDPAVETWVWEHNEIILGFMSLGASRDLDVSEDVGELWALYLDPEYWGQGQGRAMMELGFERLVERGYEEVVLWVLADNARAIRFYTRAGFREDPKHKFEQVGEEALDHVRYRAILRKTS